MDLTRIAVRALIAYVYLLLMTRFGGKRVVAQAAPFDFVVALIVGDLIDDAIWAEVSMAKFAAGTGSLFVLDAFAKIGSHHCDVIFRLINGRPRLVLENAVENRDEMRAEQMNEGDLAHLLRREGIEKRGEVRLGIVERAEELAVLRTPECEHAHRADAERVREMTQ